MDSGIRTLCEECVFADYNDVGIQAGCKTNRLEAFERAGATVTLEGNSYKITDRACNRWRDKEWLDGLNSVFSPEQLVAEESSVQIDYIIYIDKTSTPVDFWKTIRSIDGQRPLAREIVVLANGSEIASKHLSSMITSAGLSCKWRISWITDPTMDRDACLDLGVSKVSGMYYTVVNCGDTLPDDFSFKINFEVEENLRRITAIRPLTESGSGLTVLRILHKMFGGNKSVDPENQFESIDVMGKIMEAAQSEGKENHIVNFEDLNVR